MYPIMQIGNFIKIIIKISTHTTLYVFHQSIIFVHQISWPTKFKEMDQALCLMRKYI